MNANVILAVYALVALAVCGAFIWQQINDRYMRPKDAMDGAAILFFGMFFGAFWPLLAILAAMFLGPGWLVKRFSDRIAEHRQ